MRERTNHGIVIMDDRGRTGEGCNHKMLWNDEWDELRGDLLWLLDRFDYFVHQVGGEM